MCGVLQVKNKDFVVAEHQELMQNSSQAFVRTLFPAEAQETNGVDKVSPLSPNGACRLLAACLLLSLCCVSSSARLRIIQRQGSKCSVAGKCHSPRSSFAWVKPAGNMCAASVAVNKLRFAVAEFLVAAALQGGKAASKVGQGYKFSSVGSRFKKQLQELMDALHQMEPHYIRCIKPNSHNRSALAAYAHMGPRCTACCGGSSAG